MLTLERSPRRLPVAVALAAVAFALVACGGDDDDPERADTQSAALGEDATSSLPDEPASPVPQDSDLDIEVRNPDGTVLRVNRIAFEGDNISLEMEVVNGSPRRIIIHSTSGGEGELRLVDDAGNKYSFVPPPEDASAVYTAVEQGQTLRGTFTFLGPLLGRTEQLRVVTNVDPEHVDGWSLDDEVDRGVCCLEPGFVVPIDLSWE